MVLECLFIGYLTIGFIISHFVWRAYEEDDGNIVRDSIPKWVWAIIITSYCLIWPVAVIIYKLKKEDK